MRTLKSLVVCTAAAVSLAQVSVARADDTEAQAKARQAAREKVQELSSQPAVTAPKPAPAAPVINSTNAITKARQELRQEKTEPVQPLVVPKSADDEVIAKAREAARQKVEELERESKPVATAPKPATESKAPKAEVKPVEKAPVATTSSPKSATAAAQSPKDSTTTTTAATPAKTQQPTPSKVQEPRKTTTPQLQPFERTPLPISEDRQQKLADLLKRYMADELTPEQYHAERGKILKEQ